MDKAKLRAREVPKRIWLLGIGSAEVTWCDDPNPSGEPEELADAVEYVRATFATTIAAEATAIERERAAGMIPLTPEACRVLERMTLGYGYPAADVAADTQVPLKTVKKLFQAFEVLGLASFHPFFDEDSGKICGAGYSLRRPGDRIRSAAIRNPSGGAGA